MLRTRSTVGNDATRSGLLPVSLLAAAVIVAIAVGPALPTGLAALGIVLGGAGPRLRRGRPWTPADAITTTRLGLIIVCTGQLLSFGPGLSWAAVIIGSVALALDAVDGFVARRTQVTDAGAAFDETVDALFVLVLSVSLAPLWGPWTVLPGLYYYVFRAVTALRPKWQRRLPFSQARKVVAAAQGILLIAAGSPPAQALPWFGITCVGLALAALTWSFGRDIVWLERHASHSQPREAEARHDR